jgi:uncharacterized membrane protein YbjE (DUF340 family)
VTASTSGVSLTPATAMNSRLPSIGFVSGLAAALNAASCGKLLSMASGSGGSRTSN